MTREQLNETLRKLLIGLDRTDTGTAVGIQTIVQFEILEALRTIGESLESMAKVLATKF
jgi:hypothetical protein